MATVRKSLENTELDYYPQMSAFVEVQESSGEVPTPLEKKKKKKEFGHTGEGKRVKETV